jgi:alkanesulfonate monooxygenase SsuD/methylene tetrahydromethanopterin reductase-like flavin-dependent oxidoreductase (luciferase family)
MKLGLAGINVGTMAVPEFGRLAALAESLGYDSLWTAEHIILPDLPPGETPRPGTTPFLDSMAALGFLAAHTKTMKLATGVLLLPQHNPLLLAKQLASVDVLCNGRLIVGIGVGSIEVEARGMNVPMSERGARANDYLNAMIAMWTMPHPTYSGRHVSFGGHQCVSSTGAAATPAVCGRRSRGRCLAADGAVRRRLVWVCNERGSDARVACHTGLRPRARSATGRAW